MRHRTLGAGFTSRFHSSESRHNHDFSPPSGFQFRRSHAIIEARRVVLGMGSGMATKNSKSREINVKKSSVILVVENDKHHPA